MSNGWRILLRASGLALVIFFFLTPIGWAAQEDVGSTNQCRPTPSEPMGPFYEPGAPVRSRVGEGYVLSGTVKSARDCSPIAKARIEFWLTGPDGEYDRAHRATVIADNSGGYRFESNFPEDYGSRPPHIHIRATAPGHKILVTQHYPDKGRDQGHFDLVLETQGSGQ